MQVWTMKIKVTDVARQEFEELDADVRSRVLSDISQHLPAAIPNDPTLRLEELGADVSVHSIDPLDLLVLYRILDYDNDGQDEAVILTVIRRDELPTVTEAAATSNPGPEHLAMSESTPKSARIGRELVSKIRSAGV
jgi:hypothetical protein